MAGNMETGGRADAERLARRRELLRTLAPTAQGLAILQAASASTQRAALGLGTAATQAATAFQPADALLDILVGAASPQGTGFIADILAATTFADACLAIKAQLADPILDDLIAANPAVFGKTFLAAADVAAARTLLSLQTERDAVFWDDMFWHSLPNMGWTAGNTGTGSTPAVSTYGVDSTEKAQGVIELPAGTTTTGRSSIFLMNDRLLFGQGTAFEFEARVAIQTASTVAEEYGIHIGFFDNANASAEPADCACFRYLRTSNANWAAQTRSNTTNESLNATSVAPTTQFQTLKIIVNAAGSSVTYYIDGALVQTHSAAANIPTGAGRWTGVGLRILKSAGSTSRSLYVDWVRLRTTATAAR